MAFAAFLLRLKVRRRWIPALFAVVYVSCAISATYAQSPQFNLAESGKIKIGITNSIPLIETGFCQDFKRALTQELASKAPDITVEKGDGIVNYHQDENHPRYQALIDKAIDIECGTNSKSSENLIYKTKNERYGNFIEFSDPFYTTSVRLLLKKDDAEKLNDLSVSENDFRAKVRSIKKIGVIKGTTTEWMVENAKINGQNIYKYKIIEVRKEDKNDKEAKYKKISEELDKGSANGGIDALVSDGIILKSWLETKFNQKQYAIAPNKEDFLIQGLENQQYGLVFRKNSNLSSIVNDVVRKLAYKKSELKAFEHGINFYRLTPSPSPAPTPIRNELKDIIRKNFPLIILLAFIGLLLLRPSLIRFILRIIRRLILRMVRTLIKFLNNIAGEEELTPPASPRPNPPTTPTVTSLTPRTQKLRTALISAFPSYLSLEQMLSDRLDRNLRAIASEGNNLNDVVYKLTKTADSQGWLENLVRAAYQENSGNPQLRAIYEEFFPAQNHNN